MVDFTPVEHDPFTTTPVDHDPFAAEAPQLERIAPQMNIPAQQQWGAQAAADVLGNITGISDAARAWRGEMTPEEQRNFALTAAAGMIPGARALKPAVQAAEEVAPKAIRAYHGSPYDFDKFDLSKIGTGEGAQAYGHGLYFAENPAVAKEYKEQLTHRIPWPDEINSLSDDARSTLMRTTSSYPDDPARAAQVAQWGNTELRAMDRAKVEQLAELAQSGRIGKTYEVSISADPDHFLHWDKPLSEQSPYVQKVFDYRPHSITDEEIAARRARGDNGTADFLESQRTYLDSRANLKPAQEFNLNDPATVQKLRDAGIPGIKYLDQGSRGQAISAEDIANRLHTIDADINYVTKMGDKDALKNLRWEREQWENKSPTPPQTHNYVVFDDKLVNIIKKYGIAGLIAGGGAHFATTAVEGDPFAGQQ